jgi:hypothetical protein
MADKNDSVLDKAEGLARRLLEKLGAKVDTKLGSPDQRTLSAREIGNLAAQIERAIDVNLRPDKGGTRRVAPNLFKVLFVYENATSFSPEFLEALAKELKAAVFEFINNRRYETRGPIEVTARADMFAKTTTIKAAFTGERPADEAQSNPVAGAAKATPILQSTRTVVLQCEDGRTFRLNLKSDGGPAYIGRTGGNAVWLDDASVSRLHCSIALHSNGDVVVADLGSANGTLVNDQLLNERHAHRLQVDDVITVGDFNLTVAAIA